MRLRVWCLLWVFVLVGCGGDVWPGTRPGDFTVHYETDGGAVPVVETLELAEEGSFYTYVFGGAQVVVDFAVDGAVLDALFKLMQQNKFETIETFEDGRFERGGDILWVSWEDELLEVNNSGPNFVGPEALQAWSNSSTGVRQVLYGRTGGDPAGAFQLLFDETVLTQILDVHFELGSAYRGIREGAEAHTRTLLIAEGRGEQEMLVTFANQTLVYTFDADEEVGVRFVLTEAGLELEQILEE